MKIVLIFIGLLLPFYTLLIISANAYIGSLESQATQNAQSILDINLTQLEMEMDRIDAMYYELQSTNTDFQRLRSYDGGDEDKLSLFRVNQTLRLQNPLISVPAAFYLYLPEDDVLLYLDSFHEPLEIISLRQHVRESPLIREGVNWSIGTILDRQWIVHTTEDFEMYYGAMIDLEQILQRIREGIPYERVSVWITDEPAENGMLSVSARLSQLKKYIHVEMDGAEVRARMPMISRIVLAVGLIAIIFLPLILIRVFMRMIVGPIRKIEEGMYHIGSGESNYRIPEFRASREFEGMRNSFNNMANEIETLKIKQYEEQLEREQMMLQNILLQIRPHFLLNFFNQIFSMAELRDYEGIKKSSLYLSRYFRYRGYAEAQAKTALNSKLNWSTFESEVPALGKVNGHFMVRKSLGSLESLSELIA